MHASTEAARWRKPSDVRKLLPNQTKVIIICRPIGGSRPTLSIIITVTDYKGALHHRRSNLGSVEAGSSLIGDLNSVQV